MNKDRYFRYWILRYYEENKRDFFWRRLPLSPFQIMITELFLKKTKAETVDKRMLGFVKKYNTNRKLFKASKKEISSKIAPLGLGEQRTRGLIAISKYLHDNYNDKLPDKIDEIIKIPHIGMYTANAVMCFGYNKRSPILDVNISRIISRYYLIKNDRDLRDNYKLQEKAKVLVPRANFKEYIWGLLDLGALVCRPRPLCGRCPLKMKCSYHLKGHKYKN